MLGHTYLRRALLGLTAGAAMLAVAAGCGGGNGGTDHSNMPGMGSSTSSDSGTKGHNSADVMFAQMMIPHHRQAIEMADLAPSRAASQKIKDIAKQIADGQSPEITTMSGWLKSWGEKVPAAGSKAGGMNMDDGMMSEKDMATLKAARGAKFDAMFAQMMIAHHNGAISMARDEQANGKDPDAKKLAATIVKAQTAEISTLRGLSGGK
jgi:uncharacterized protein (DUF305 family)